VFSLRTDAALLMVQAEEAQWVMKADGYLWLEVQARVTDSAVWNLVREETGVRLRRGANGELLLAVVQEQVRCAMEFGFSTLGDAARVNLTFGCGMGDATLVDVRCNCGVS
jgi:hypothetical protein